MAFSIFELAGQLVELQRQAEALGLFIEDRELLHCESCGLHEDITAEGKLITSIEGYLGCDSGLRFDELSDSAFRCPQCGEILLASGSISSVMDHSLN